jgi:hypothetical protein
MNAELVECFKQLGLSEAEAKIAASAPLAESVNPANHGGRSLGTPVINHDGTRAYEEINRQNAMLRGRR